MSEITITLAGSEVKAEYSGSNAWLRNDGTATVYAAKTAGITAGAPGVTSIPAGQSAPVYGANGEVYLLGTGSVMLIGSDYSTNPFKTSAQSGGSGADEVARAAIEAHSGNTEIHVTAAEKAAWNTVNYCNPNLLTNPDFAINQRGQSEYSGDEIRCLDRWAAQSNGNITITPLGSGVQIENTGTNDGVKQLLDENTLNEGQIYTISADINGVRHSAQITANKANVNSVVAYSSTSYYAAIVFENVNKLWTVYPYVNYTANGSAVINNAKLELGGIATPFTPPDPATELAKCQRYLYVYRHQNATSSTDKCTIGVGYALTSSIVYAVLPIATMRSGVTATISHGDLSLISGTDTVVDYTSVTALEQTDNTVQFAFAVSNQTPGTVYRLRLMNSNAYLAVSKEL